LIVKIGENIPVLIISLFWKINEGKMRRKLFILGRNNLGQVEGRHCA
jgi:hypothetical protein